MNTAANIAATIIGKARRSDLAPADRLRAIDEAAQRLRALASDDPIDVLATEMVAWVQMMSQGSGPAMRAEYAKVADGLTAEIDEERRESAAAAEIEAAAIAALRSGHDFDLSRIVSDHRGFVERVAREILHPANGPNVRAVLIRNLLDRMDACGRDSVMGGDEMLIGAYQHLGRDAASPDATSDAVKTRIRSVFASLMAA